MQGKEYQELHKLYVNINQELDKVVREANDTLEVSGKTAHELLKSYSAEKYSILNLLQEKINALDSVKTNISRYVSKKETFENFVEFYVGQPGQWLSYIRELGDDTRTTSLDAIAKLKGICLTIWVKDPKTQKLYVVHSFKGSGTNQVDMFHTHGLTHFNLLRKIGERP